MTLQTWWLFLLMTFVVSATPGPNMLLVMATSARLGLRRSVATMAGCLSAVLAMMTLSASGLAALLQAQPVLFDALRLAGAIYLAWLGVQQWRAPVSEGSASEEVASGANDAVVSEGVGRQSARSLFLKGWLVAASNPKAILFAAAFFPQFIHADAPALPQFSILLTTFAVVEVAWYGVYAAGGDRASRYLRRPPVMRGFNRLTGGVFVGFALLMADVRD
jgi:threonine/homoserine/homoserine lactone efflux protein